MVFNAELIEMIAKIAVLVGEHIIPAIINICCPDHSDDEKSKYHDEIKKKIGQ